ncbi:MAG: hypothetical protein GY754_03695 [bacterium]|nr:hypothetical protein [bacterium]
MKYKIKIYAICIFIVILSANGLYANLNGKLLYAAQKGNLPSVKALLAQGAKVNTRNRKGNTPLLLAVIGDSPVSVRDLSTKARNKAYDRGFFRTRGSGYLTVQYLLRKGAWVKAKNYQGYTALHWAAARGDYVVMNLLIKKGASVNAYNKRWHSPLYMAIQINDLEAMRILVSKGARMNRHNKYKYGGELLEYAAEQGDLASVKRLIQMGAGKRRKRQKALRIAALRGWSPMANYLLSKGVTVYTNENGTGSILERYGFKKDENRRRELTVQTVKYFIQKGDPVDSSSLLRWAARMGNLAYTKEILGRCSRLPKQKCRKLRGRDSEWAYAAAIEYGQLHIARYYLRRGVPLSTGSIWIGDSKPLHRAARYGHLNMVKFFVGKKIPVNSKTSRKKAETPLHIAVEKGHMPIVQYLIRKGARIDIKDGSGATPFLRAVKEGNLPMVQYLLEIVPEKNVITFISAAVETAVKKRKPEILRYLLQKSGSNYKQIIEKMFLQASSKRYFLFVQELLKKGVSVNTRDKNGNTPLHSAAEDSDLEAIQFFVENGAGVNLRNNSGNTPLLISSRKRHMAAIIYLTEKGTDVAIKNNSGHAALYYVGAGGVKRVLIDYLKENGAE